MSSVRERLQAMPKVDAHHHLWDLAMGKHPWLIPPVTPRMYGDHTPICKDYLIDDFRRDSAPHNVVKSVHVQAKLSGPGMVAPDWTADSFAPFIHATIELFGPARCMFASNVPPDAIYKTFDDIYAGFYAWSERYTEAEQRALFHDTASRFYRL